LPSWSTIAKRIRVPVGFAFAGLYLWLAHPTVFSIVIGTVLSTIGLLIRAFASAHVRKNEVLTVSGPYAYTRNPLYFGSSILALGFVIASRSWWVGLIAFVIFFAIYFPVIRSEEEFLRARFPEFEKYALNVPRLVPRLHAYKSSAGSATWHLYWKHREYNAALGALLMIAALVIKCALLKR
jgi:protein-S-isoprenylcysteine O-methyltransferase Ste14